VPVKRQPPGSGTFSGPDFSAIAVELDLKEGHDFGFDPASAPVI